MNSMTKTELHLELSLLRSALEVVLMKLSLLNGAMRKCGITVENPMDLMHEAYDVARCHLARLHYEKKQRFLQYRMSECNSRLKMALVVAGDEEMEETTEDQGKDEEEKEEEEVRLDVEESQPQPPSPGQRNLEDPPSQVIEEQLPPQSQPPPPPPPPAPPRPENPALGSHVLTRQWSSSSSPPAPEAHRLPTPVPSPAKSRLSASSKSGWSQRERALWPSDDDERDGDEAMVGESDSLQTKPPPPPPPRPLSLPLPHLHSRPLPSVSDRPERRSSLVVKQQKLFLWRKEIDSRLEAAYHIMKRIVPRGIPPFLGGVVITDVQTTQFCYHFGFRPALGKRILQKRCLWLISFTAAELSRVTAADLEEGGAYALKGQALDLTEMSAIYYRLDPLVQETSAGEGPRQEARVGEERDEVIHKLRKKLNHLLTLDESGTLPESLKRHPAYGVQEEQEQSGEPVPSPERRQSQQRRGSLRFEEI
jgi:hypothetical protein